MQSLNQRSVYKQRGGNENIYFYEETDTWWQVGPILGGSGAALLVTSRAAKPVCTGWKYWDEGWKTDSTLRLDTSPSDPSSSCTSVKVAATGPADSAQGAP